MQKAKILIFCTIFVASRVYCQHLPSFSPPDPTLRFSANPFPAPFHPKSSFLPAGVPADFYSSHLGFFCKQEIRLEKETRIPFKFRLGSVAQCDRLEGKPGTGYGFR
jgi:hypothetical protein